MSEAMDKLGFKHKVGDYVTACGSCTQTTCESFIGERDTRYQVLERTAQECPGGIQLFYKCRSFGANGGVGLQFIVFLDIEVEASEPFRRMTQEEYDAKHPPYPPRQPKPTQ